MFISNLLSIWVSFRYQLVELDFNPNLNLISLLVGLRFHVILEISNFQNSSIGSFIDNVWKEELSTSYQRRTLTDHRRSHFGFTPSNQISSFINFKMITASATLTLTDTVNQTQLVFLIMSHVISSIISWALYFY